MARQNAQTAPRTPVLVAGYGVTDTGNVFVILKDKVSKIKLRKVACDKVATIWMEKGFDLSEVKAAYPVGEDVKELAWGEAIPHDEIKNIHEVVEM